MLNGYGILSHYCRMGPGVSVSVSKKILSSEMISWKHENGIVFCNRLMMAEVGIFSLIFLLQFNKESDSSTFNSASASSQLSLQTSVESAATISLSNVKRKQTQL